MSRRYYSMCHFVTRSLSWRMCLCMHKQIFYAVICLCFGIRVSALRLWTQVGNNVIRHKLAHSCYELCSWYESRVRWLLTMRWIDLVIVFRYLIVLYTFLYCTFIRSFRFICIHIHTYTYICSKLKQNRTPNFKKWNVN